MIFEFGRSLAMVITGTEMRHANLMAKNYAKSLDMDKVFAVHEFCQCSNCVLYNVVSKYCQYVEHFYFFSLLT